MLSKNEPEPVAPWNPVQVHVLTAFSGGSSHHGKPILDRCDAASCAARVDLASLNGYANATYWHSRR